MPIIKITKYQARWEPYGHKGMIWILLTSGSSIQFSIDDPNEFNAIVSLLRNEKPMYWNVTKNAMQTLSEEVGEEET